MSYKTKLNPFCGKLQKVLDETSITTLATQTTNRVYVDGKRTDSYTATGSVTKPYKTIQAAIDSITTNTVNNRFEVLISAGKYEEQVTMKNYVALVAIVPDAVFIESDAGDVVTTSADANIFNVNINYSGSNSAKVGLKVNTGAILVLRDTNILSNYTGIEVNNGSIMVAYGSGALTGAADSLVVKSGGWVWLSACQFTGWGSPYYDLTIESSAEVQIFSDCQFYNNRINNAGTLTLLSLTDKIKNNSNISGTTLEDALNNIKTDAVDKAHTQDTDTILNVTETPASNQTATGIKCPFTAGENLVFGNACYIKSDGKAWKGDADALATSGVIAMALESITAESSGSFLLIGIVRDDSWTWNVGELVYLDTTEGALTQTPPSGSGDVIQVIGVATHADRLYFNPNLVQTELP